MASALFLSTILVVVNLVSSSPIFLSNSKPDGGNLFGNILGNIGAEASVISPAVDLCLSVDLFGNPNNGCENPKATIPAEEPTPPCEDSNTTTNSVTTPSSGDSSPTTERITTTEASKTTPTSPITTTTKPTDPSTGTGETTTMKLSTPPCEDPNSTTAATTTDCGCE